MKKITLIADTHNKHNQVGALLPGGDILICAGDVTGRGYKTEVENFAKWFDRIDNYDHKIFIAGNHEFAFQDYPDEMRGMLTGYKTIDYLEDELMLVGDDYDYQNMIKVYGTPWQPEFCNWAFNLKRGEQLKEKWDMIPMDTDILVTHGPPFGKLDMVIGGGNVGCEDLIKRVKEVKPKINVFGHIHCDYGYVFDGDTHYFNAAVVNERYIVANKPHTFLWDKDNNEIEFV